MKPIDADKLIEKLSANLDNPEEFPVISLGVIMRMIDAEPEVHPAQKKGHWIDEGTNYCCSECHRGCWINSTYCPWCGAYMRGGSK